LPPVILAVSGLLPVKKTLFRLQPCNLKILLVLDLYDMPGSKPKFAQITGVKVP